MDNSDVKTIKGEWLSVIFLILLQSAIIVWWAAKTDARVAHLESQSALGERFTAQDGKILANDIIHIQYLFDRHANRTEPKIDDIHNAVLGKYNHE